MPYNRLSTARIARYVGCHPNTVRLYEQWGLLPPIPRSPSGYRLYTEDHQEQMLLARTALNSAWPGRPIRRSAMSLIRQAASGDLGGALESAYNHLALVRSELNQADTAVRLLERWAQGIPTDSTVSRLGTRQAALLLRVSVHKLRNWERDGLLSVPRDPSSGYRQYGQVEIARLRVIRMLRSAGYSTLAILRMLVKLDRGETDDPRQALNHPPEEEVEDVYYASDRWFATLTDQEQRSHRLIEILEKRIRMLNPG